MGIFRLHAGGAWTAVAALTLLGLIAVSGARAQSQTETMPPAQVPAQSPAPAPTPPATPKDLLPRAKSWGYQLTGLDVGRLAASPYDVLVIDYSRDGSEAEALKPADLERLKRKPDGGRRVVLSYLSIGEAEDYRYYWNASWENWYFVPNFWSKPSWLGPVNGDWGGNYAVRYWEPEWQKIILGEGAYLDRIVRAGFDGVWLDKVDSSLEDIASGNPNAKAEMIAFIAKIGERGRAQQPGFLVVPQNGEDLLADPRLLPVIDGFGKESLLFGEDGPQKPNTPEFIARKTALLKAVKDAGKGVLAVEYLDDPAQAMAARERLAAIGFAPLNATRELDVYPGDVSSRMAARGRGRARAAGLIGSPWTWLGLGAGLLALMLAGVRMSGRRL